MAPALRHLRPSDGYRPEERRPRRGWIRDRLDDGPSRLFGAFCGDRLVGTVRFSLFGECDLSDVIALYGIDDYARAGYAFGVISKLFVDRAHRRGRATLALMNAIIATYLEEELEACFLDARHELDGFYRSIGFKVHRDGLYMADFDAVHRVYRITTQDLFERPDSFAAAQVLRLAEAQPRSRIAACPGASGLMTTARPLAA